MIPLTAIPYARINAAALPRLESLLSARFPNGRRHGREFKVGSLVGESGTSLCINLDTGKWKDFGNGSDKGGADPVSIFAAADHNGSQSKSARALGRQLGAYVNGSVAPHVQADKPLPE